MGISFSKQDHNTALLLCKDRIRYIKDAIDARYALSAAHLSYLQSVRNLGTALRQFIESETLTEPAKSPSHSYYASHSLSPSPLVEVGSPFNATPSPLEKNYMRASTSAALKVAIDLNKTHFLEEEGEGKTEDLDSTWDFFDQTGTVQNTQTGTNKSNSNPNPNREEDIEPEFFTPNGKTEAFKQENHNKTEKAEGFKNENPNNKKPNIQTEKAEAFKEQNCINDKTKGEIEKEDQLITHRAKDLVLSMREIEQRFLKAAEFGHEVSRMLETRKIRLKISNQTIGKSSSSLFLAPFLICCKAEGKSGNEGEENVAKIITWNRSVSSQSSNSRNPLINSPKIKDNSSENGSDFVEEFCMISGSHSSTLDRLFAWEKKLHDELKASENIRRVYDQQCTKLRHQFAKDFDVRIIDKTRANVKDLHSRLTVAIQAVDSISRRIEKLRDDELQPQLFELLQGLTRMWKAMLETYHAQHITISLAYHTKDHTALTTPDPQQESKRQALIHLKTEMECFNSTFSNWIKHHKLYVESLNSWLQKCILQPQERSRGRKITFSPRRAIAPPIFVILRDWCNGVLATEFKEGFECVKKVGLELSEWKEEGNGEEEGKLGVLRKGLVRIFEEKRGFCENMVRVYENVKEEGERAKEAYSGFR
ncbi:hypothetical protein LUZ60_003038 [Juncus effusus]|nr:hypothetical protein LUZ60_003038 [Juncus effusus]